MVAHVTKLAMPSEQQQAQVVAARDEPMHRLQAVLVETVKSSLPTSPTRRSRSM
jgi:hypothetical protein